MQAWLFEERIKGDNTFEKTLYEPLQKELPLQKVTKRYKKELLFQTETILHSLCLFVREWVWLDRAVVRAELKNIDPCAEDLAI